MRIDYRRSLEKAARQMILIHRPDTLVKLILRAIQRTVKVRHAGMFIYDKSRDAYVVKISRGFSGLKIPSGFAKLNADNPLITYFTDQRLPFDRGSLLWDKIRRLKPLRRDKKTAAFISSLKFNLSLYSARACIPSFCRRELVAVLFLGEKINRKSFVEEEVGFLSVLASDMAMAIKNAWLVEDLNQQLERNKRLLLQVVSALASSIEAKDQYTKGHTERVVDCAMQIARRLKHTVDSQAWSSFTEELKVAALLHDIGKIGIPEVVLNKPDVLSEEERRIIQKHPLIGQSILGHIEGFESVLLGVKYHHERYDGCGYPEGLKGKKIPFVAAIIALADAFDAMTSDRPYRQALSLAETLEEVRRNRGKQFSPIVVDAFLKIYENKDSR